MTSIEAVHLLTFKPFKLHRFRPRPKMAASALWAAIARAKSPKYDLLPWVAMNRTDCDPFNTLFPFTTVTR